jgi:hypothetical protein
MYKRGKGKIKSHHGLSDVIKIYKEDKGILKHSTCSRILRELNEELGKLIVLENLELNFAERVGTLRVRKFKININKAGGEIDITRLGPDWAATRKLWKETYPGKTPQELKEIKNKPIVRHLNKHSNGYSHEFYYSKKTCNIKNKTAYSFRPARALKNLLTSTIKNPNIKVDFYE